MNKLEPKEHFHGSDLEKIEEIYGIPKENIISFSANVNPLGISYDLRKELPKHLDAITRYKLQDDLLHITKSQNKTVIFVTHDIDEAVFLADKIVIMSPNPGRIKAVIPIGLGSHRDRTGGDFLQLRDKVFRIFNMKEEDNTEYYI